MKANLISKIEELYTYSKNVEAPEIVFITKKRTGYEVSERYIKRDTRGMIKKGLKIKRFELSDLSKYDEPEFENTKFFYNNIKE